MKKWKPRQFFHFLMHLMQSCIFSPEEQTTSMDKRKITFLVVWTWNILNTKKQGSLCKMKDKDNFALTRCIRTSCFVSFAVFGWCHWQLSFSIFFLFTGVIVKLSIKTHNRKVQLRWWNMVCNYKQTDTKPERSGYEYQHIYSQGETQCKVFKYMYDPHTSWYMRTCQLR